MKTALERRIARVARSLGIAFAEAAAVVARRAARRRAAARRREAEQLTRVRSTWAWRNDFES